MWQDFMAAFKRLEGLTFLLRIVRPEGAWLSQAGATPNATNLALT
jgi:hypothetical protein